MVQRKPRAIRIVKVHPTKLLEFKAKRMPVGKKKGAPHAVTLPPIAPGFTPRPDLDLQRFSGKTLQALSFLNVYLGSSAWSDSDIANIDQAIDAAMSDPTLNNVIQQYFVGPITSTFLGNRRSDAPVASTFTRDSVSRTLDQLYSTGQLAGMDLSSTVINLLLPPGTILDTTAAGGVGDLDDEDSSLQGLGGYHGSHIASDRTAIYFAAAVYSEESSSGRNGIPVWPDPWKNVVATLYHELNEARTDADVEQSMRNQDDNLLGWYSRAAGEIGDIPIVEAGSDLHTVFVEVTLQSGRTAPVQLMWSNGAHGPGEPFASSGTPAPGPGTAPAPKKPGTGGGPPGSASGIKHVVIIVKENHTFDNYFGTFPGAEGATLPPAQDPQNPDPLHDHGAWLRAQPDGGQRTQYSKNDIPAYWAFAQNYALCDNYFTDVASQSEPNHLHLIAADSPVIDNASHHRTYQPYPPFDIPSLPAALAAQGLSWRNYADAKSSYFDDISNLRGSPNSVHAAQFDVDVQKGFLPEVAWLYAPGGLSEHPGGSNPVVGPGMQWTVDRVLAVAKSPDLWASTAIFITWDDWGGWNDHVVPQRVANWTAGGPAGYSGSQFRYGPRVPCLVVSPYAKRGVNKSFLSHVSIVKFCLRLFGLQSWKVPALATDDRSGDMWDCFDFASPPRLGIPPTTPD